MGTKGNQTGHGGMARSRRLAVAASALAVAGGVSGCTLPPHAATATIVNGQGRPVGVAALTEEGPGRVRVTVVAGGLTPGEHGTHLHTVGRCDPPDFTTAGAHLNPAGRQHGLENPQGPHAGDLPNLVVGQSGVGFLSTVTDRVTLRRGSSLFDADGTSIVVHAARDDQRTDPTGNSGARVACGVLHRVGDRR